MRGRVGGCAADAVIVGSQIIRRDIGVDHCHRVGSEAAAPTDIGRFFSRGAR